MSHDLHHLIKNSIHVDGRNPDVDAGTEDVWSAGGTWVAPTAARVHTIVSTSTSDAAAGSGARTVQVYGLDSSWNLQNETVSMAGTSDRSTTNSYLRIYRLVTRTVGNGGVNDGAITATANTDATVTQHMPAEFGCSPSGIMTTPSDAPARLVDFAASHDRSVLPTNGIFEIMLRPDGEPWRVIPGTVSSYTGHKQKFQVPLYIPPKTDVKVRVTSPVANMVATSGFSLVFPNTFDLGETD